jgi:poly(A)-specific ribonuclease
MRPVASRYNIIQLGLCTFTREKGKGKGKEETLVARPYNIYTCADEGEDVCLSLSAITFLRGNNMDFNRWLSKGVTYLNAAGEEALRQRVEQERERDRQKAEGGGLDPSNRLRLTRCVHRVA